jgi:phosphate-selective porin
VVLVAAAVLWLPASGEGQTTSDAGSQQAAASAPLQVGFHDGFFIETADGNTRLNIGLLAQTDGRFFVDESQPPTNTFLIRKVRPTFTGRIMKYFDFRVMPDFGNGTSVIQDANFDIRFSPKFRIRSGKDKVPVGYEWMIGDAYVVFPERSFVTDLVPNRDVGIQALGDLAGDRISYAGGVFNGVPDGTSSTTDTDTNRGKDVRPSSPSSRTAMMRQPAGHERASRPRSSTTTTNSAHTPSTPGPLRRSRSMGSRRTLPTMPGR